MRPLFFIIIINNLRNTGTYSTRTILYADDTNSIMNHEKIGNLVSDSNMASSQLNIAGIMPSP